MSLGASLKRFNTLAAKTRAEAWPATFTLSTDTTSQALNLAASPPQTTRVFNELRSGYVQQTTRVILMPRAMLQAPMSLTVASGSVFTCTADELNPDNVGTLWSVKPITGSNAGSELRLECWRVDA